MKKKLKIENEYQNVEKAFGEDGSQYVQWAAKIAVGLKTGVPWVMCKQTDAPDPVVSFIRPNFSLSQNFHLFFFNLRELFDLNFGRCK